MAQQAGRKPRTATGVGEPEEGLRGRPFRHPLFKAPAVACLCHSRALVAQHPGSEGLVSGRALAAAAGAKRLTLTLAFDLAGNLPRQLL